MRKPKLREWLEAYAGTGLSMLPGAAIVPLGAKVAAAMRHLADLGRVKSEQVLDGLPHPSGANAERIAYFLGENPAPLCSAKTNTATLDTAREALCVRVNRL